MRTCGLFSGHLRRFCRCPVFNGCRIVHSPLPQSLCCGLRCVRRFAGDLHWIVVQRPGTDTVDGLRIQATGQKLIVYAAIIVTLIQAHGAIRLLEREAVANQWNSCCDVGLTIVIVCYFRRIRIDPICSSTESRVRNMMIPSTAATMPSTHVIVKNS